MPKQVHLYSGGKRVGYIEDGELVKMGLEPAKHKMRKPAGWALSQAHVIIAKEAGVERVTLAMKSGVRYHASFQTFLDNALYIHFADDAQFLLADEHWH